MLPMDPLSTTSRDELRTRAIDVLATAPLGKHGTHRVRLVSEGKTHLGKPANLVAKKLVLQGTDLRLEIDTTAGEAKGSYPGVTEFVLELPTSVATAIPPQPLRTPDSDHERTADAEPRGISALEVGSGEGADADAEGDAADDADAALRALEAAVGAASGGAPDST